MEVYNNNITLSWGGGEAVREGFLEEVAFKL